MSTVKLADEISSKSVKLLTAATELVIVTVSVVASVVTVIPVPAAIVSVSFPESATTVV